MVVEEITLIQDLEKIKAAWESLLKSSEQNNLFLTYEWISIWLKHFWNNKPISFAIISNGPEPVGLAPFLVDEQEKCYRFPVNDYSHRPDFIIKSDYKEAITTVLNTIKVARHKYSFYLHEVSVDSPFINSIESISESAKLVPVIKESSNAPFLTINGDYESFFKSKSKHFQREQLRKLNKIKKEGNVRLERISSPSQIEKAIVDILKIERNSWKEKQGTSFTADPKLALFYSDIARYTAQKGWYRSYILYLNSNPIAHLFGIAYQNKYYALKTSYDLNYRNLSPGVVLFQLVLQDVFEAKISEFDFLGVESRWKNELASGLRKHVDVYLYSRSPLSVSKKLYENSLKPFIRNKAPFVISLKNYMKHAKHKRNK